MPEQSKRFQCRHIFTDGRRCGSPCLRKPDGHEDFCYYHHTSRRPAPCIGRSRRRTTTFTLPLMEDRSAVQHSIGQVLQKLAQNELDPRRAGLLLYGLQIASINLPPQKRTEPEKDADTVEEITTDPSHGTLAIDSELVPPELKEKNSAREVLEEWNRSDRLNAANLLPSIQAVADPRHPKSPKSTANTSHCKTLRNEVRVPVRPRINSIDPNPHPLYPVHAGGRAIAATRAQVSSGGGKSELRRAVCRITSGTRASRLVDGQCNRKQTAICASRR